MMGREEGAEKEGAARGAQQKKITGEERQKEGAGWGGGGVNGRKNVTLARDGRVPKEWLADVA